MAFGNMLNKLGNAAIKGADLIGKASESIADLQAQAAQKDGGNAARGQYSGNNITDREELTRAAAVAQFEPIGLAPWEPFNGESRRFNLNGETLCIDADMDIYNTYRQRFFDYAKLATDSTMEAFSANVHDLESYLSFFPAAYEGNLESIISRAIDALVSSGVFYVTAASFKERHLARFHSFGDMQATISEAIENASQANRQIVEGVANLLTRSPSSGGILSNALYELRDKYNSSIVESAAKINPEQAKALFDCIDTDMLAKLVFADYWFVHLTLVSLLLEEGKLIWWLSKDQAQRAQNIFQNLSNPNFPQEQRTATFTQILKANPYREEYHQYMIDWLGENGETKAIRDYFGFGDPSVLGLPTNQYDIFDQLL